MKFFNRWISFLLIMAMLLSFPGEFARASAAEPAPDRASVVSAQSEEGRETALLASETAASSDEATASSDEATASSDETETLTGETQSLTEETGTTTDETETPADETETPADETPTEETETPADETETPAEDTETQTESENEWRIIDVEVERAELYEDEGKEEEEKKPTESLQIARRFWNALFSREPSLAALEPTPEGNEPELPLQMQLSTRLPEGATAKARVIEYDEREAFSENALFDIELTIYDAEGNVYIPEEEINLYLTGETVGRILYDGMPMLLYIYEENPKRADFLKRYSADVLVYRDVSGSDERRVYIKDEPDDAVRFTEAGEPLIINADESCELNYSFSAKEPAVPLRFVLTAQLPERFVEANADGTAVSVYGPLSESVSAEVTAAGDVPGTSGDTLLALDISLSHSEAENFEPDTPLTVLIQDPAIGELMNENGTELEVWSVDAEGTATPVENAEFVGDAVAFDTDALTTYVITYTRYYYYKDTRGDTWKISASWRSDAGIPENAELSVVELLEGTPEYEDYVNQTAEALGVAPEDVMQAKAFDITLIDPETGAEYQPTGEVSISIDLLDAWLEQSDSVNVLHFGAEQVEIMNPDVRGETVEFVTNGFSVFVVVKTIKTMVLEASDGSSYRITVTYDSASGVPEDAELSVEELLPGTDAYEAYVRKTALTLGQEVKQFAFARAFDISLINPATGEHYQPTKPIEVSIQLLKENIQKADSVSVVHFPEANVGKQEGVYAENSSSGEILAVNVNGEAVEFEATGFSVYVVSRIILEDYITATDGNTYKVTVTFDETAHLPEDVMLHVAEVTQESADFMLYLDQVCGSLGKTYDDFGYARFFDISLVSGEDPTVHYQPDTEVEVSIQLIDTPEETVEGLQVLHIGDDASISDMEATAEGNALLFKTSSFSIYPIIDGDSGPNARLAYRFWYYNAEAEDYEQITTQYFRYKDVHPDGGAQGARIYEPAIPGNDTESGVSIFDGWHTGTPNGASVDMDLNTTVTIAELNTQLQNFQSTEFVEGTVFHIVAKLKDAYYITYSDTNPLNVLKTQLVIKASEGDTTFSPDATVVPTRNGEDLVGWRLESEAGDPDATLYEAGSAYPISKNITLVPVINNGHWLVFDDNDLVDDGTGNMVSGGASFTPAAFYMNSSTEQEYTQPPADPTWEGYVFEGWYSDPACTIPFTFGEVLEQDMTVHAKWLKGPSAYTVIIWKQKSTDAVDAAEADKTYDFAISYRIGETGGIYDDSVKTGDLVWLADEYTTIYGESGTSPDTDKQFFKFNDDKTPDYIIVKAGGGSVMNVYYDRVTMTMNFYTYRNSSGYVYSPTTSETGTLYGYVEGLGYVPITKAEGSDGTHSYSYSPTYNATTGDTGTQYGIIDGEYQELTATPVYSFTCNRYDETSDTGDATAQYALISGHYVELTRNTRSHYYPTTGTRYTVANDDHDNDPQKVGFENGSQINVYWDDGLLHQRWYNHPTIHLYGQRYNGAVFTTASATASDIEYTGTLFYINGSGFSTSGSGTPYGKNGDTYFPLRVETEVYWTYNNTEYDGQRYIRYGTKISYFGQRYTRTGGTSVYDYTYSATEAQTSGLYGVDERGGHIGLDISSQPTSYIYSYNGTTYTGTRYIEGNNVPVDYSGTLYQKNGAGSFTQTATDGENRYGVDGNGAYRLLVHKVTYPDVWQYTDTNTGEIKTYPSSAQRYTGTESNQKSWQIYKSFTGLYGSSLSTYGYEWPTEYNWYYNGHGRGGNFGTGRQDTDGDGYYDTYTSYGRTYYVNYEEGGTSGSRMTLKTTFEPLEGSLTASFYGNTPSTSGKVLIFYKEQLDGSYAEADRVYLGDSSGSISFSINDKYSGFHAAQYRANSGSWQNVGSKNPSTGYYGSAVTFSSQLEIRYARTGYSFNYITNNASSQIISKSVKYEASLAGYGDQSAGQKPGYYFVGWFADDALTVRAFFDQASYDAYTGGGKVLMTNMPDHNETVYGKWLMERTRVVIVPGGSDVRMGSQALSFRLDYGERISSSLLESATRLGYVLDGWYTDPDFTNRFLFSTPVISGLPGVSSDYQTSTRWTASRVLYHDDDEAHQNVRNIFTLYAKWVVDTSATGIKVVYDAGVAGRHDTMGSLITEVPVDSRLYQSGAVAVVGAPPSEYNELFVFDYWEAVDKNGNVLTMKDDQGNDITQLQTGTVFSVDLDDDKYFEQTTNPDTGEPLLSIIKLRAQYHTSDQASFYTSITYNGNEFERADYPSGNVTVHGKTKDGQDQLTVTLDTKINDTIVLPGEDDFYLEGYKLVGWSFFAGTYEQQVQHLTNYNNNNSENQLINFGVSQKVAADQLAQGSVNTGDNRLYAMWQPKNYTVTVKQVVEDGVSDTSFTYRYRSGVENAMPSGSLTQTLNGNAQQSYTTFSANSSQKLEYYERVGHVFQIQTPTIASNKDYAVRVTAYVTKDNGTREAIVPQTDGSYSSYRIYGDITITYTYVLKVNVKLVKKNLSDNSDLNGSKFTLTPVEWNADTSEWVAVGAAETFNMSSNATASNMLLEGVYRVEETQAPTNFAPLGVELLLTVKKSEDFSLTLMDGSAVSNRIAQLSATSGDGGGGKKHTLTLFDRELQTVTVTKQVTGTEAAPNSFGFTVHITLEGANLSEFDTGTTGAAQDITNSSGYIEFRLSNAQSKEIRLPYGSVIEITEKTPTASYYLDSVAAASSVTDTDAAANTFSFTVEANNTITFTNIRPICKIVDGGVEHPFYTLRDAVSYARTNMGSTATIEMLVDYVMPDGDYVVLTAGDNITLTTASATQGTYTFHDTMSGKADADRNISVIKRGYNGASLFTVGGTFTVSNIILDGGSESGWSCKEIGDGSGDGGIVKALAGATLNVQAGVTMRNSLCEGTAGGGAICASGSSITVNITGTSGNKVTFYNCTAIHGGAVFITGTGSELDADFAVFSSCAATKNANNTRGGGGICVDESAHATVSDCEFRSCSAPNAIGGGFYAGGGNTEVTIENSAFESCTANGGGGMFCHGSVMTVQGETAIKDCIAGGNGGGINVGWGGTLTVTGSVTISGCEAANGGGINVETNDHGHNVLNLSGGTITGNTATNKGGALHVDNDGEANISGGSITGNSAASGGAVDVGGTGARLNISGAPVIYNNKDASDKQKNVVLSVNSDEVINVTGALTGGDSGAKIGVYAVDVSRHTAGADFGSYGTDAGTGTAFNENLDVFKNDANEAFYGVKSPRSGKICWAAALTVEVYEYEKGHLAEVEATGPTATGIYQFTEAGYKAVRAEDVAGTTAGDDIISHVILSDGTTWTPSSGYNYGTAMIDDIIQVQEVSSDCQYKVKFVTEEQTGSSGCVLKVFYYKSENMIPVIVQKVWNTPDTLTDNYNSIGYAIKDDTGSQITAYLTDDKTSADTGNIATANEISVEAGQPRTWQKVVFVEKNDADTYSIEESSTGDGNNLASSWNYTKETSNNNKSWINLPDYDLAYVRLTCNFNSAMYQASQDITLLYRDADGVYYRSSVSFKVPEDMSIMNRTFFIEIPVPRNNDVQALVLVETEGHGAYSADGLSGAYGIEITTSSTVGKPRFTNAKQVENGSGATVAFKNVAIITPESGNPPTASSPTGDIRVLRTSDESVVLDSVKLEVFARRTLTMTNSAICKIVDDGTEHIFGTLKAAVKYARSSATLAMDADHPVTIQMLVDYTMPSTDAVTLNEDGDNIILTTAPTAASYEGEKYLYSPPESEPGKTVATITRGYNSPYNSSLFNITADEGKLTLSNITIDGNKSDSNSNNQGVWGGLVRVISGSLVLDTGATLKNSKTRGHGGAIYAASGASVTINAYSVITDCEADSTSNANGGAIYMDGGTLEMNGGTITNCLAANGGAIYLNSTDTLESSVYTAKLSNFLIDGHTTGGLDAATPNAVKGGAIFVNNGALLLADGEIRNCSASDAAGGAINVASGKKVYFEGDVVVFDNKDSDGSQKNMVLEQDSNTVINTTKNGLGGNAHIGVYVAGDASTELYQSHGQKGMDFGTYDHTQSPVEQNGAQNLYLFTNDRNDLAGEIDSDHNYLIRWQSAICKITINDGGVNQGKLLTYRNNKAVFSDLQAAFNAAGGALYLDGTRYNGPVKIEMLVGTYELPSASRIEVNKNAKVTLTTAKTTAEGCTDGYPYTGTGTAVIERGSCTTWMFHVDHNHMELTLENITIDGKDYEVTGTGFNGSGALIHMHDGTVTMGENSTLQNGKAQNNGGAVYLYDHNCHFIMDHKTAVIKDCTAGDMAGAIMIYGGSATIKAGTITGNSSTNGGAINFHGEHDLEGLLYLSGSPVIYNNGIIDSEGNVTQQKNVDLTKMIDQHEVTTANVIKKIIVNGTLNNDAHVGVYAPEGNGGTGKNDGNDKENQFFGKYTTAPQDSFTGFHNDKYLYLVGKAGTDDDAGKLQWQKVICKIVDSNGEHVFPTLNTALTFARSSVNPAMSSTNPVAIQMLVDYKIPSGDKLVLDQATDNIIITTAAVNNKLPSGEKFAFAPTFTSPDRQTESVEIAILKRDAAFTNDSLFKVSNTSAKFTTRNIILDGGAKFDDSKWGTDDWVNTGVNVSVDGGIISNAGTLDISEGTTLRNTAVSGSGKTGGAVYSTGTVSITGTVDNHVTITDCLAKTAGAIYTTQSAKFNASYVDFSYCKATSTIGAVNLEKASAEFIGATFRHCISVGGNNMDSAGAIRILGAELFLKSCDFEDCSSKSQGGAIFHKGDKQFKATSCTFTDCRAGVGQSNSGGAFETQSKDVEVDGCTFTRCTSSRNAGAINFYRGDNDITATIKNSTFTGCTALTTSTDEGIKGNGFGGALRSYGNKLTTIENCSFSGCEATWGGAIACFGSVTIKGTTSITGCTGVKGGGVYLFNSATLNIEGSTTIQGCVAKKLSNKNGIGGGIYQTAGTLNMSSGSIIGNTAESDGGGIYLGGTTSTFNFTGGTIGDEDEIISDGNGGTVTIEKGNSAVNGGGIYQAGGTLTINGGSVKGNAATSNGGGIYLGGGTLTVEANGKVISNVASGGNGGGIYLGGGTLTINSGAIIRSNTARASGSTGGNGGGIYLGADSTFNLYGEIGGSGDGEGNTAVNGGGIYQAAGTLTIGDGVSVTGNTASGGNGGGIFVGGTDSSLTLSGTGAIKRNTATKATGDTANATGNGGGIYLQAGTFTISNGTIGGTRAEGNTAVNGAGIYQGGGTLTINGGTVIGNAASAVTVNGASVGGNGGGIYLGGGEFTLNNGLVGYTSSSETGEVTYADSANGNSAVNGGGLYVADGVTSVEIHGGKISGNRATVLGGGIMPGGASTKMYFDGIIQVFDNFLDPSETRCDVCLDFESADHEGNGIINTTSAGLREASHIGVYVTDKVVKDASGSATTLFELHGKAGKPFGTFVSDQSLNRFINNRSGDKYQQYEYYYGVRHPDHASNIYWASYICEITDASGKLLFTNGRGTAPALYEFLGKQGAFEALGKNTTLYTYDPVTRASSVYTGDLYVKMLVNTYSLRWENETIDVPAMTSRKIMLTMCDANDGNFSDDKNAYTGYCVIDRGDCKTSMFTTESGSDFTLTNIILDGRVYNKDANTWNDAVALDVNGGLINAKGSLTLGDAADSTAVTTLRYSAIGNNYSGAAVCFTGNGTFTINPGATIDHCTAQNGAVLAVNAGELTLNSALIGDQNLAADSSNPTSNVTNCTSTNGGAVYVSGSGVLKMDSDSAAIKHFEAALGGAIFVTGESANANISAGTISYNTATGYGGGAIRIEGGAQVTISGTAQLVGNRVVGTKSEEYGGAVNIKKGKLTVSGGTISGNYIGDETTPSQHNCAGGAIHVGGTGSDSGTLEITGGTISGNSIRSTKNNYGGAISMRGANAKATITGGTINGNHADSVTNTNMNSLGGAVAVMEGAELTLGGAAIQSNTVTAVTDAYAKGPAIYVDAASSLDAASILNLSGIPSFGTDANANTVTLTGYESKTNGSASVYSGNKVRQDIYIAEGAGKTQSLVITEDFANALKAQNAGGELNGAIWVWAENEDHYKQHTPFATLASDAVFAETPTTGQFHAAYLKVFRNARDDENTDNPLDSDPKWLFGTIEDDDGYVYWYGVAGSRKVILRKIDSTYESVKDMTFIIYKGSSTTPYIYKDGDTRTQLGGTNPPDGVTLDPMKSLDSGVFWTGNLPYGWYILEETSLAATTYFYLVVTANGVFEGPAAAGGTTLDEARTAAAEVYAANK